jgi:endoglucanase
MKKCSMLLGIALMFLSCQSFEPEFPLPSDFVQVDGQDIRLNGSPFWIKGIAFGNQVWKQPKESTEIIHHSRDDYFRLRRLGFNAVRFYLNERLFSSSKDPEGFDEDAFQWIDQNIAWAKEAGVYLILNMHVPPGGFQPTGLGDALWTQASNQDRLADLWREIARRYTQESQIIGYGLVNEPVPLGSSKAWEDLAQRLVDAIRREDPWHILFVEKALYVKGGEESVTLDQLFPNIKDPGPKANLVYEFHFYEPMTYTHQGASWIEGFEDIRTSWPDPDYRQYQGTNWAGIFLYSAAKPQEEWHVITSEVATHGQKEPLVIRPALHAQNLGKEGKVSLRNGRLEARPIGSGDWRVLWDQHDTPLDQWIFWSSDGPGSQAIMGEDGLVNITGAMADSNTTNYGIVLPLESETAYRLSGEIRSENLGPGAKIGLRLDQFSYSALEVGWDRDFLQERLKPLLAIGQERGTPVYLGEFGLHYPAFQGRGGEQWVRDMLSILEQHRVHFNYHTYHEPGFGLYTSWDDFPLRRSKKPCTGANIFGYFS